MGETLKPLLVSRPPRETSGPRSSNRFDYQKNWIIFKAVELFKQKKSFIILCDYHEDVVLLDNESNPKRADFFQIKTLKGGHWTLKQLLAKPNSKNPTGKSEKLSILGKLYSNFLLAPHHTRGLHFVSNAYFSMTLKNSQQSPSLALISCHRLAKPGIDSIKTRMKEEFGLACKLPKVPSLTFEVAPLSLDDHETHTKGKVGDLLENLYPKQKHHMSAAYRTLFGEIGRKTNNEGTYSDYSLLINKKGLSRSSITQLLDALCKTDWDETWAEASQTLTSEGMAPMKINKIHLAWQKYEIERINPENETLQQVRQKVRKECSIILFAHPETRLTDLCIEVTSKVPTTHEQLGYANDYICAIALMEAYEINSLQEASSQFKEEE